jgi:hypothetical protein
MHFFFIMTEKLCGFTLVWDTVRLGFQNLNWRNKKLSSESAFVRKLNLPGA